ncbi:hypothetical protein Tco_0322658 [Tanacetum coccineum]
MDRLLLNITIILILFGSLDESYLTIRSNIFSKEPLPLVKAVFAPVSSEESHRNASSIRATKPAAIAFAAKTFDNKRRYFELVGYLDGYVKRNFNASTRPVTSNNFSADVHSNNAATDNRPSNSLVSLSNELLARLMSLLNDNDVYSMVCKCFKVNIMDISNLGLTVGHTNGTQALITKIGDLKINNDITLYDVLVVPECTVSLLSVLKIARDSNLFVVFDETKCYIQDLKANNIVEEWIPSSVLFGKSPYLFMYAHDPSLSHFRVLGCLCYATIFNIQYKFSSSVTKDLNNKNFFDNENPKRPNDERRVSSYNDVTELNPNSEDDDLPVNVVRRSSRHIKLPTSLNDFIVEGKVKYGIERVVNYTNLNSENFYFASSLNESIEHTCDKDVILDNNWIDAMNVERSY